MNVPRLKKCDICKNRIVNNCRAKIVIDNVTYQPINRCNNFKDNRSLPKVLEDLALYYKDSFSVTPEAYFYEGFLFTIKIPTDNIYMVQLMGRFDTKQITLYEAYELISSTHYYR